MSIRPTTTMDVMRKITQDQARQHLLARLDTTGECWLWQGGQSDNYGIVQYTTIYPYPIGAHRAAYALLVGPIPQGQHVHHTCDQKLCCNPDHLELLTPSQHSKHHHPKTNAPCPRNHPPHWRTTPTGKRQCRHCDSERHRRKRASASRQV
jgi:hypothetical protein